MSFRDQLKDWKKDNPVKEKKAEKAKAPKKVQAEPAPEPVLSDEELFLQAVAGVDKDAAVLKKFAQDEPARAERVDEQASPPVEKKDVRDEALFRQWVQDMDKDMSEK